MRSVIIPGLALLFLSTLALAQTPTNPSPDASQKSAVTVRAHSSHRHRAARMQYPGRATRNVEVTNGTVTQTQVVTVPSANVAKHGKGSAASGDTTVEVINGLDSQTVVFNAENAPGTHPVKPLGKPAKNAKGKPGATVSSVQVINGTSSQTQFFYGDANGKTIGQPGKGNNKPVVVGIESGADAAAPSKPPIVVGVESGTASVDAGKPPVVVSVASSGTAKNRALTQQHAALATPLHPRRPPYHPPAATQK